MLDVPGHPAERPALERGRRLPAPGAEAPEPRRRHRRARCSASSSRATAPSASAPRPPRRASSVARAEREVDPRAPGAIGSPQLLMLSGIGPADELREAGVEVAPRPARRRAQPPGPPVRDRCSGRSPTSTTLYGADKPQAPGRVAAAPHRAADLDASPRSSPSSARAPGLPAADIQFHMGAAYYEDHGADEYDGHAIVDRAGAGHAAGARAACGCARPIPTDKPRILTNSLSEPEDVASLVAGMQLAREIAAAGPLRRDRRPRAQARARGRRPRATSRPTCAAGSMLIYHPVGTCRMGARRRRGRRLRAARPRASRACGSSTRR